jgi:predicted Rdx family selenoprotein
MHGIRKLCIHKIRTVDCVECLKALRKTLNEQEEEHTDKTNIVDIFARTGFKFKMTKVGVEVWTDASGRGLPDTLVTFHFGSDGTLTSITAEREGD